MQVPGGTKKTERRRSRSRNRQEIESELARKLNEIPMVHDTIEYLLSSYSLIKVFNQITSTWDEKLKEFDDDLELSASAKPFSQIVISLNLLREIQGKSQRDFSDSLILH